MFLLPYDNNCAYICCCVSPAVPDYRALYAKLDKLRLDAANMWAIWLNGNYLQLVEDPDSPADSGMALQLKQVWWLELGGSIPGEESFGMCHTLAMLV